MSSEILDAALEYLDMGLSIIPVRREDKKPYLPWKEYQTRRPTVAEVEAWWERWPEANVAVVCGELSGIFIIDADGPKGVQWITENLPKSGVYVISSPGHVHVYCRQPKGVKVPTKARIADEVDIRGDGGYAVLPPSIHVGGHRYEFQYMLEGWSDLAELDPTTIGNGHKKTGGNLQIDLSKNKVNPFNAPVAMGARNDTLARLAGSWVAKGLDRSEVEVLARQWNAGNSPPLGDSELIRTIDSILKTHCGNHPEAVACEVLPADLEEEERADEIPADLLTPGGGLQQLMEYIEINSAVSVPYFNLAAALVAYGAVMGQKVMTETGLRTNIYAVALGYSGSGKNGPIGAIPGLIGQTQACPIIGPTELTSSVSILKTLESQPVCLTMFDEIGLILKGLSNPNSPLSDVPRMFTKLFSGTDRPEIKNYTDAKMNIVVHYHHLSMFGASTPERFWESLTSGEVADGFLARVLLFESHHEAPYPKTTIGFTKDPALIKRVNDIWSLPVQINEARGNLAQVPIPRTIPRTLEAQRRFSEWARWYHDLKNEHRRESRASIYGRAAEHAAKIALVHSVATNTNAKEVELKSIDWACSLVDHLIGKAVKEIETQIHDNMIERQQAKLIAGIRRLSLKKEWALGDGKFGASWRDICRGPGQGMSTRELKDHLDKLIMAEQAGSTFVPAKNGRDVKVFYIAA